MHKVGRHIFLAVQSPLTDAVFRNTIFCVTCLNYLCCIQSFPADVFQFLPLQRRSQRSSEPNSWRFSRRLVRTFINGIIFRVIQPKGVKKPESTWDRGLFQTSSSQHRRWITNMFLFLWSDIRTIHLQAVELLPFYSFVLHFQLPLRLWTFASFPKKKENVQSLFWSGILMLPAGAAAGSGTAAARGTRTALTRMSSAWRRVEPQVRVARCSQILWTKPHSFSVSNA